MDFARILPVHRTGIPECERFRPNGAAIGRSRADSTPLTRITPIAGLSRRCSVLIRACSHYRAELLSHPHPTPTGAHIPTPLQVDTVAGAATDAVPPIRQAHPAPPRLAGLRSGTHGGARPSSSPTPIGDPHTHQPTTTRRGVSCGRPMGWSAATDATPFRNPSGTY